MGFPNNLRRSKARKMAKNRPIFKPNAESPRFAARTLDALLASIDIQAPFDDATR
jgi:hypothetical protein